MSVADAWGCVASGWCPRLGALGSLFARIRAMRLTSTLNWDLFTNLARREVRGRYKGSFLGLVWTLVIPLVMMVTYTVVFSVLWRVANMPNYWLFLLIGIGFWAFFGGGFSSGAASLVGNASLITKVSFPRAILPISALTSQAITMLIMLGIMIPFSIALSPGNPLVLLLLPVVLFAATMLVIGFSLAISVLNVYFRDVEHIVAALLIPWFFITPIIYTLDSLPQLRGHTWAYRLFEYGNVATPFVMALQDLLYYGRVPKLAIMVYVLGAGVFVLVGGYMLFNRLQQNLAVEL